MALVAALAAACRARPDAGVGEPPRAVAVAPLRIAMIAKSASNPSFLASRLGAENRARALSAELGRPIEIEWLTPPREDAALQVQRIQQAVAEKVGAVLLSCSDVKTVTPAIDDAVAHGVPVMTFDSDAPDSRRFATCGVDDVKAGQAVMKELAQLIPRRGKVAVLAGNPDAPNLRRRVEGVMSEAAHHPGLTHRWARSSTSRRRKTPRRPSCAPKPRTRTSRAGRWSAAGRSTRRRCCTRLNRGRPSSWCPPSFRSTPSRRS